MPNRKIIHIDMDAFYASVEQRDNPELRGKPVAVGYAGERGVVSAASYEARKYGVHSAMASLKAMRLCPELVFVPVRMEVYKEVSDTIHSIFRDYTDIIEPLALDEAFLDVTTNKCDIPLATDIAKEIRRRISEEVGLTASAGVSYNKFLAKIASDYRKPNGLCTIHPDQALDFIARLPIESFWGVGKVTARRMHALGIHRGHDLREWSLDGLTYEFGKAGKLYYEFARGIDLRPVEAVRVRKSIGCERTLERDINTRAAVTIELYHTAEELIRRLAHKGFRGKYSDTENQISRLHPDYPQHYARTRALDYGADTATSQTVAGRSEVYRSPHTTDRAIGVKPTRRWKRRHTQPYLGATFVGIRRLKPQLTTF